MNIFKKDRTFDEILPIYLKNKKITLRTHKTFQSYKSQTEMFSKWLIDNDYSKFPLKKIDKKIVDAFFVYLADTRDLDRPTCKKYYNSIKGVFNYAIDNDELITLPFKKVPFPTKKRDCSAQVIPPEKLKILLEDIKQNDKQLFLACLIEYYCFIRPGKELRLIKGENFDLEKGTIRIESNIAKNGRQRIVTMPNHLVEVCNEYGIGKNNQQLFIFGKNKSFDTRPLSENMLRYRFNHFREKHNLGNGVKLYSFKHSGATTLHTSKIVSMVDLMNQLGHSNLTATQHYIKKKSGTINNEIKNNFPSPI